MSKFLTQKEFQAAAAKYFEDEVMPLLQNKGGQYSKASAFTNFLEGSSLHDITPGKYLMVMATKHWHNLCKNPDTNVEERCKDIIVYMLLLIMMNKEN